jgi:lipopolysaccharide/colanic/teichoic acid biosynthesis glycosyltransferase
MKGHLYRAADVIVSLLALVACGPILMLLAAAIWMSMGRPILFAQLRSGRNGNPFKMVKFRSMTDARDFEGVLLPDTDRTTPLGRFLRRSRLDELPEFWNVLTGRMSLIGPRPILPDTIAALGADGVRRGAVRPGLTGWAQICGNSSLSNTDKLALDLWYIEHRSLKLDFIILLGTIKLMIFGEAIDHSRLRAASGRKKGGVST